MNVPPAHVALGSDARQMFQGGVPAQKHAGHEDEHDSSRDHHRTGGTGR